MNFIKKCRVNKEMTQATMADACGVTQATVAMWEKGTCFPRAEKLGIVAKVLGCKPEDLLRMAEKRRKVGA